MSHSSRVQDYLGEGVSADIPSTLDISTLCLGLYYATDTQALYAWNGSSFDQLTGAGSGGFTAVEQGLTIVAAGTIAATNALYSGGILFDHTFLDGV